MPGMSMRSKSAINGTKVDVSHLEREIRADVATYRQYKAEDGMKKRAIHTSKDYGEFRNFVSVSQLKPTSGRDVSSLFNGASGSISRGTIATSRKNHGEQSTIGGFDDIIQRRRDASNPSTSMAKLDKRLQTVSIGNNANATNDNSKGGSIRYPTKTSRAAHDFLRDWKQHCITAVGTLAFITRIDETDGLFSDRLILQPREICKEYFSTDIDSEIVGDIVEALHLLVCMTKNDSAPSVTVDDEKGTAAQNDGSEIKNEYHGASGLPDELFAESNAFSFVHSWLEAITTCGRFGLSVTFLVPAQQKKLKELCDYIKDAAPKELKESNETSIDELLLQYNAVLK